MELIVLLLQMERYLEGRCKPEGLQTDMTIREAEEGGGYEFGFKTMEDFAEETGQTFKEVTQPDGTVQMVAEFKTVPEKNPYEPKKIWKAPALQAACSAALFDGPTGSGASALTRIITGKFFSKDGAAQHEDITTHGASIAAWTRFVCHPQNPLCTAAQTERRFTDDANEEQPEEGPNAETEEEGRDEM